ncbi:LPXTG-motif cell wall anchor domain-containing protein [Lentzea albidocapillata subsp. violacea]|uniref:LPXTG-motif cell wall anchor domain-containing protein n=1 Tax=Lentzea albidocapillata subsp. violacea TaxID=128104 RepID=A0A1G9DES8_9PSEU|nr:LPXTG-motif cell wall anchor domain-containing protein [Lentzea albidocapillata subsp. violacea]
MFAAVLALSATTCFTAYAQEDPVTPSTDVTAPSTSTQPEAPAETTPTETTTPTEPSTPGESTAPPVSETPADKPEEKPADQVEQPAADPARSDVQATSEVVGAGPFLVGQAVTVKLTITNSGTVEATGVAAWSENISGSYFNIDDWDGLRAPWGGAPDTKLAAGESRTFTLKGRTYSYAGNAKFKIRVNATNDRDSMDGSPTVEVPFREPVKTGTIGGILWGDANGNGVQDAGEGLAGAQAYLYGGGDPNVTPRTRTDANGRFTFTGLELRTWGLNFQELPGGWVLQYSNEQIPVDGSDSTSELRYKAVRPLNDQLSASLRFTSTDHVAGGFATVEFTLTNKGGSDISGIVAGCNRSGEGPHMAFPDGLGDLDWDKGATILAGQSRVFTVLAGIPLSADRYGHAYVACDFGTSDGIIDGYPGVFDYVKVGDKRTDTNGSLYVDRDGNGWMNGDEHLTGVSFSLVDPKTGVVAGTASGTGEYGQAYFTDIPAGLYEVVVNGPWKVKHPEWLISAQDCTEWCNNGWAVEVVPSDEPGGTPGGTPGGGQPEQPVQKVLPVKYTATAGALADTGASVSGLGLVGALTLLVGGASVFLARRRTA